MGRLLPLGVTVLGVSPDSVKSHKKFTEKFSLPFPLLADPDHTLSEAFGVWVEKSMYGRKYMGIERSTFIIDGAGVVRKAFRKVNVTGHVDEVIEAVKVLG
jgi:thioredoxin-dependent peroxiredoxin